jgi:hypothetical protein
LAISSPQREIVSSPRVPSPRQDVKDVRSQPTRKSFRRKNAPRYTPRPEGAELSFEELDARLGGIDPSADPPLELRAAIYLISGRRRAAP